MGKKKNAGAGDHVGTIPDGLARPDDAEFVEIPRGSGGSLYGDYLEVPGSKRIILLCHGFSGDRSEWGRFPKLAETLRDAGMSSLAFDFYGSGATERVPITLDSQINDVWDAYKWAESRGYETIDTVGLSFGGLTTVYPRLPRRSTAVFWAPAFFMERIMGTFNAVMLRLFTGIFRRPFKFNSSGPYPPILIKPSFVSSIKAHDVKRALSEFEKPALVVQGTADPVVKPEWTREAFSALGSVSGIEKRLVMVDGATHDFSGDHLVQFIDATINWLQSSH